MLDLTQLPQHVRQAPLPLVIPLRLLCGGDEVRSDGKQLLCCVLHLGAALAVLLAKGDDKGAAVLPRPPQHGLKLTHPLLARPHTVLQHGVQAPRTEGAHLVRTVQS